MKNISISLCCDVEKKISNVTAVKARLRRVKRNPQRNPSGSENIRGFFDSYPDVTTFISKNKHKKSLAVVIFGRDLGFLSHFVQIKCPTRYR